MPAWSWSEAAGCAKKSGRRIVAEAEKATGGKVEIGALQLDWRTLTAELDNLTIHGTEPADAAPLLAVKRVVIGFKIISFLEREFNVARVEADNPRGARDYRSRWLDESAAARKQPTGKTGPETILALKIGKFDLANGLVAVERMGGAKDVTPWNARGENLTAHVSYTPQPAHDMTAPFPLRSLGFVWNGLRVTGAGDRDCRDGEEPADRFHRRR